MSVITQLKPIKTLSIEDATSIVRTIHPLMEIEFIGKFGILGETFENSYRKYGDAFFEFEISSIDRVTDGYYSFTNKFRIKLHHKSIWFEEYSGVGVNDVSNYNRNHHLGYKKLENLGYDLPLEPQWL